MPGGRSQLGGGTCIVFVLPESEWVLLDGSIFQVCTLDVQQWFALSEGFCSTSGFGSIRQGGPIPILAPPVPDTTPPWWVCPVKGKQMIKARVTVDEVLQDRVSGRTVGLHPTLYGTHFASCCRCCAPGCMLLWPGTTPPGYVPHAHPAPSPPPMRT